LVGIFFNSVLLIGWVVIVYLAIQVWRNLQSETDFWVQFLLQWPVLLAGKYLTNRGQIYRKRLFAVMLFELFILFIVIIRDIVKFQS
jgi:hypothetical protein